MKRKHILPKKFVRLTKSLSSGRAFIIRAEMNLTKFIGLSFHEYFRFTGFSFKQCLLCGIHFTESAIV